MFFRSGKYGGIYRRANGVFWTIEGDNSWRLGGSALKVVYQLRIALKYIKPPVWRRIVVPGDIPLDKLHTVIQTAMGWQDYHLHEFAVKPGNIEITPADFRRAQSDPQDRSKLVAMMRIERTFLPKEAVDDVGMGFEDEAEVTLSELCPREKDKLAYVYDFGDHWVHDVIVQKILPAKSGVRYPVCTAGKRACPPEDCGGPLSYDHLLGVLDDPGDEEYDDMLEWVGDHFDPEAFDIQTVNEALAGLDGGD